MRKFDNDELRRRVDEVLYDIWDPIGVNEEPYARAEYDSYVPKVFQLVLENNAVEPISSYLAGAVRTSMGLVPKKKKCDYAAQLLLSHKKAIEEGCA